MRTDEQRAKKHEYYSKNKERHVEWQREYYQTHPEYRARKHQRGKELDQEKRLEVLAHYSGGTLKCATCSITDIDVLSLDHINGGGGQHRRIHSNFDRWIIRENFPSGFQVLCRNCNWKKYIIG